MCKLRLITHRLSIAFYENSSLSLIKGEMPIDSDKPKLHIYDHL